MAKIEPGPGDALLATVRAAIARDQLLAPAERVLVGLSGGPDSVVLLHALLRLGYAVGAAHLDHGWRPESAEEARQVLAWCEAWGVPCVAGRAAGPATEEAAREARYAFLAEAARTGGYAAVAVGHHMDDQAETVLFRLARGTGLAGLAGMRPRRPLAEGLALVRPLLGATRAMIEAAREAWGLPAIADPTNALIDRARSRLRHEVLPALEAVSPGAGRHLAALAARAAEEEALGEERTRRMANHVMRIVAPGLGEVDRQALLGLANADRRRLLRHLVGRLGSAAWDAAATESALGVAEAGGGADLGGGWRVVATARHLVLAGPGPRPAPAAVAGPGAQPTGPWGWRIQLSAGATAAPAGPVVVRFDADAMPCDMVWRSALPDDDRFQPWGHAGARSLRHFLARSQIPRHRHESLLVLASGSEVYWVVGVRRGGLAPLARTPENVWEMQARADFRGLTKGSAVP